MLFNPKWQKTEDNCDVTLRGFTAWVEAQKPKARYDYAHKETCAVGRWLQATDHFMLLLVPWGSDSQPVLSQAEFYRSRNAAHLRRLGEAVACVKRTAVLKSMLFAL